MFDIPFGRYKWNRLPFGTKVSSELFVKHLHLALGGLEGVECVADDIIVHGKDDEDHDEKFDKLLQECRKKGIKLNLGKCIFKSAEIPFLGLIVTKDGLKIDNT